MPKLGLTEKLAILADAAKHDVSCASGGSPARASRRGAPGVSSSPGICQAYAPDGRRIALLRILMTNECVYDCAYCANRASASLQRARFTPEEIASLTMNLHRRKVVDGLFLSSGVVLSPDHTMEQLVRAARLLREAHLFRGYIHLKTIPEASPELIDAAGRYADRLSINVELPSEESLRRLAPEKSAESIRRGMGRLGERIAEAKAEKRRSPKAPGFAPAGQSTQMIVGADDTTDAAILAASVALYRAHRLRRVYYAAYSPVPGAGGAAPAEAPPPLRERRLHQADELLRLYGFSLAEFFEEGGETLDLATDPKLAWALRNRDRFPARLDSAERETLLRIPGLGLKGVETVIAARRRGAIRLDDFARLSASPETLKAFVETTDWRPGAQDREALVARLAPKPRQLELFG